VGARFSAPAQTVPGAHPASCTMGIEPFPEGKERPGRDADPSPPSSAVVMKEYSYTSTPPMGRTACTEPQCLYKGDLDFVCTTRFRTKTEGKKCTLHPRDTLDSHNTKPSFPYTALTSWCFRRKQKVFSERKKPKFRYHCGNPHDCKQFGVRKGRQSRRELRSSGLKRSE